MALQNTGQITINDLVGEFGGSAPHSLNEYYRGGGLVPDTAGNSSVPTSGQISLSNFYGAQNYVFPVASGGTVTTSGNTKYHTFTSSGTFTVSTQGTDPFSVVVIGGGGGGAFTTSKFGPGAGGGYSGTVSSGTHAISPGNVSVTIGGGGSGKNFGTGSGSSGGTTSFGGLRSAGGGSGGAAGYYNSIQYQGNGASRTTAGGTANDGTRVFIGNDWRTWGGQSSGYAKGGDGDDGGIAGLQAVDGSGGSGGGGGAADNSYWCPRGGNGGSGVVIVSYEYQ